MAARRTRPSLRLNLHKRQSHPGDRKPWPGCPRSGKESHQLDLSRGRQFDNSEHLSMQA